MTRIQLYFPVCLFLASWLTASSVSAQEPTQTVSVWGQAVAAVTQTGAQTQRAAKDHARMLAVEQVAGTRVDTAGLIESGLERSHFLQTMARGYVVREEVLEWQSDTYQKHPTDPPIPILRVHLKVDVALLPRPQDPTFAVNVTINRNFFEAGDAAELTLGSRRDAWAYLFNVTASDQVVPLFPNPYQSDNHLRPGRETIFPAPDCGICLEMATLPGHPENAEAFLTVAFPSPQPMHEYFEAGHALDLAEFYRRLMRFPIEKATLQVVPYVVRARTPSRTY